MPAHTDIKGMLLSTGGCIQACCVHAPQLGPSQARSGASCLQQHAAHNKILNRANNSQQEATKAQLPHKHQCTDALVVWQCCAACEADSNAYMCSWLCSNAAQRLAKLFDSLLPWQFMWCTWPAR